MDEYKITLLSDNRLERPLTAEHGFSLLIEQYGKRILFDTGQGEALFHNAETLGVELTGVDYVILSHGHYDHGGNIARILSLNPDAILIAHPNCTVPRYSLHKGKPVKSVALTKDNRWAVVGRDHSKLQWSFNPTAVTDRIHVTGEIPRHTDFEDTGGPFFLDMNGKKADLLHDDMALWIDNGESVSVVCGCCHSGIVNTLTYIKTLTGKKIDSLIGGLHLLHANENRLKRTFEFLEGENIRSVKPCHCSGDQVLNYFTSQSE